MTLIDRFLGFLGTRRPHPHPLDVARNVSWWVFALMLHPPADDFAAAIGHSGAATFHTRYHRHRSRL